MKRLPRIIITIIALVLLTSCGPSDKLWPSDKIGPMWVNRYGHSNSQLIWEYCDDSMTGMPGIRTTECIVPWVDELFIGYGTARKTAPSAMRSGQPAPGNCTSTVTK